MRSNIQLIVHHILSIFTVMQTTLDDEIFNIIQRWMANHHGEISEIIRNPNIAIGSKDAALTKEPIMIYETNRFKN
jgi:hypothetical protein